MWQHYRKTFIPIQIMIIIIGVMLMTVWKLPAVPTAAYLLIMEVFAVVGAMWAASLRRRILRSQNSLLPHDRIR